MSTFLHTAVSILALALGYWWGYRDRESWKDKEITRMKAHIEHLLRGLAEKNSFKIQPPNDGQKRGT